MKIKSNDILYSHLPASWYGDLWKEAFPSGNGKVGISVYGGVAKETILVNHSNLWHWGRRGEIPDVTHAFKLTKKLLNENKYREANSLTADALNEAGYEADLFKPCPVGDINIDMNLKDGFIDYQRMLDMTNGEITVSWQSDKTIYKRKSFVARDLDVIVLNIHSSKKVATFSISMQLHETFGKDTQQMKKCTEVSYFDIDNILIYQAQNEENGVFGMACRVLECDGNVNYSGESIEIEAASDITLLVKVYGNMDETKTKEEALLYFNAITGTYNEILEKHSIGHDRLYSCCNFEIDKVSLNCRSNEELLYDAYQGRYSNELYEKLWKFGRYLFISGTRVDTQPFFMYGLWGGRYDLLWSHNMANINVQMMYCHCITGGYVEYIKTFIDYYYSLIPDFKENAKKIFGLDGIMVPAGTTPGYGLMNQIVPVIVNWIGGAGWVAQHMYDYYLATDDDETLNEKILPFMLEAATFYEQYITRSENGFSVFPSVSPENTPGNLQNRHLKHMAHANPTAKNATMDIAILKELFGNLVSLSEKLKINTEKLAAWKDILNGLPEYRVNEDGAVKEWLTDDLTDFYYHRHFSHLYPVFPGREMMLNPDSKLLDAFKKAVDRRVQGGQSGWSMAFKACLMARLKNGNGAISAIELLTRSCLTKSFFTLHNDWRNMGITLSLDEFDEHEDRAPVQLDAALGVVNAIQEMILQYAPGIIWILPAIPDKWIKGRVSSFGFFGGQIGINWNRRKRSLSCYIYSKKKQRLQIFIPQIFYKEYIEVSGAEILNNNSSDKSIELNMAAGSAVEVRIGS